MLTRSQPTLVRAAGGNPFMPGSGNPYSIESNPYAQKGGTQPDNATARTPKAPKKSPTAPKNTVEDQMDAATQEVQRQATLGHIHALMGIEPTGAGMYYEIGYDEGMLRRSEALAGIQAGLEWGPLGSNGIYAVTVEGFEAFIKPYPRDDEGRPTSFMWWMEGLMGREMGYGFADTLDEAHDAVEALLGSYGRTAGLGAIVDDVQASNPGLDPRQAVRVARKALMIMTGASMSFTKNEILTLIDAMSEAFPSKYYDELDDGGAEVEALKGKLYQLRDGSSRTAGSYGGTNLWMEHNGRRNEAHIEGEDAEQVRGEIYRAAANFAPISYDEDTLVIKVDSAVAEFMAKGHARLTL